MTTTLERVSIGLHWCGWCGCVAGPGVHLPGGRFDETSVCVSDAAIRVAMAGREAQHMHPTPEYVRYIIALGKHVGTRG